MIQVRGPRQYCMHTHIHITVVSWVSAHGCLSITISAHMGAYPGYNFHCTEAVTFTP